MDNEASPMFKASEVQIVDEGLLFVCSDETEAQKAYLEGQSRGRRVKVEGKNLIMLHTDAKEPRGKA